MSLYGKIAQLPLEVSDYGLEDASQNTGGGWVRHTTVVRLRGGGLEGCGEDVGYSDNEQRVFQEAGPCFALAGNWTFDDFSRRLDTFDLRGPSRLTPAEILFRRWAFESAALDLALAQAGMSLARALDRTPHPTSFVLSLGLGDPPSVTPLRERRALYPRIGFKVDLAQTWTEATVRDLAEVGAVETVDLKGQYRSVFKGPPANPDQYRWVAELLPGAWIEDPDLNDATNPVLAPHHDRITWDAILHSLADIVQLPFEPRMINVKPSRFGFVSELLRVYEYCEARGIAMYGGGQFELGPGRAQIQCLASLFHPDVPNDVAPREFNDAVIRPGLPDSPLAPREAVGFGR